MDWNRTLRLVLRLYPAPWRARYHEEMTAVIQDELADGASAPWRIARGCLWGALSERTNPTVRAAPQLVPAAVGPSSLTPPAQKRSTAARIVGIVASAVIVSLVLVVVMGWFFVVKPSLEDFPFGPNFPRNLESGLAAPAGASVAVSQAEMLHIPLGQITAEELQNAGTGLQWVPGQVASTLPRNPRAEFNVSLTATDQHVVTAVEGPADGCAFGLDVVSPLDPVIVSYNLPGPGTYGANLTESPGHCAAINAPTTGWMQEHPDVQNGKYVGIAGAGAGS